VRVSVLRSVVLPRPLDWRRTLDGFEHPTVTSMMAANNANVLAQAERIDSFPPAC
jgi:hypothetical protein